MRLSATRLLVVAALVGGCASSARTGGPATTTPAAPTSAVGRSGAAVELASTSPAYQGDDAAARSAVASAEQSFSLRLLRRVDTGDNVTISPFSLAVALAMLENGARRATLTQISSTLGTSPLDPTSADQGWASLVDTLTAQSKADGIDLASANALWSQSALPMVPQFMDDLARYFRTGVWQVDFAHDLSGAAGAINSWVSDHTNGRITKLFGPGVLDQTTVLVLANAVYFHAAWQAPFDPHQSQPGTFHTSSGVSTQATFMQGSVATAADTPTYQAVRLAYTGGHFEALAIMPKDESLQTFVSGLDPAAVSSIAAAANQRADLRLPRFTTRDYLQLDRTLSAMGMPLAFTAGADFSAMSPEPLEVQSVVQRDYLSVGEKGTEAAAATGISVMPSAAQFPPPSVLRFDHPFLFVVRDTTTGVIVFASLVENPTA